LGILETSAAYIQNRFPEVNTVQVANGILFRGRFLIEAQHNGFVVQTAPLLELFIPHNYPLGLPKVNDVDNVITYDHRFTNGDLCVSTVFDLQLKLQNSKCISDYIDVFLIPYFISYEYWKTYHEDIFGDRKHYIDGVFESIQDFFMIPKDDLALFKLMICWASRIKKFKKCIPKSNQPLFCRKYSKRIAIIRSLGILRLNAIYKLINIYENTPPNKLAENKEFERLYGLACS
jgi:hypothetical protein